jgi:hypothetical protein
VRRFLEKSAHPPPCGRSRTAVDNWDPNCQLGNEIHRAVGIRKTWGIRTGQIAHAVYSLQTSWRSSQRSGEFIAPIFLLRNEI